MLGPIVCCCLAVAPGDGPAITAAYVAKLNRESYEAAKARAGEDAQAHTRLALWCESKGWTPERDAHLARAVAIEPGNVLARGMMGMVAVRGKWVAATEAATDVATAMARSEYVTRRKAIDARDPSSAEGSSRRSAVTTAQMKRLAVDRLTLGLWCLKVGLADEAAGEFAAAISLNPSLEEGWKRLGYVYVKRAGRWMTAENAARDAALEKAQREGDKYWEPILKRCRALLDSKAKRPEAEARLAQVDDPYAVASLMRNFLDTPNHQSWAIRVLSQINSSAASLGLARIAVFSADANVRAQAVAALAKKPAADYGAWLVSLIHDPAKIQVRPVSGPGTTGSLVIETPQYKIIRNYNAGAAFSPLDLSLSFVGPDANGVPVVMLKTEAAAFAQVNLKNPSAVQTAKGNLAKIEQRTTNQIAAANDKAYIAQQYLLDDLAAVEQSNLQAAEINARVGIALTSVNTPANVSNDQNSANAWWFDREGYGYSPPPQVTYTDTLSIGPPPEFFHHSCFVAGSLVATIDGHRAIDQIRIGDVVLAQDVRTGGLAYKPVTAVHHNPPAKTVHVTLENGETIVPSTYHRFWVAGKGWSQARDLKPGDVLRSMGGRARIASIEPGSVVPVFNLEVDRSHSYFVGKVGALVHDNSVPERGIDATPFDAPTTANVAASTR